MSGYASLGILAMLVTCLAFPFKDGPIAETRTGQVRGITINASSGKRIDAFLGIPFAQAPVQKLRFRPPVAALPWKGVLNATSQPETCYQKLIPLSRHVPALKMFLPETAMSEDCLKLNVWTPNAKPVKRMAVLVWIFGGGFSRGTVAFNIFDPRNLVAEEDVVVVAMNYRVASLGFMFLDHPEVPGNMGLLDQVMALQWVRDNIGYFGGDPALVTIFGQSAGGASVVYHLLSPLSKGLYKRAIVQSGAPHSEYAFKPQEEIKNHSWTLLQGLGCPVSPNKISEAIECARQKDAEEIILSEPQADFDNVYTFKPVNDKNMVLGNPLEILKSKRINTEELLIGSNKNEGSIFLIALLPFAFRFNERIVVSEEDLRQLGKLLHLGHASEEVIRLMYIDTTKEFNSNEISLAAIKTVSDYLFTCPLNDVSHYASKVTPKVYKYFFTHRSSNSDWPSWAGTVHGEEVPYVFGLPLDMDWAYNKDEEEFSRRIMRLWANFARTGNPNKGKHRREEIEWPKYTTLRKEYLVFAPNSTSVGLALREKPCFFWTDTRQLLDAMERNTRSCNH